MDKLKQYYRDGVVYGIQVSPNPKSTNDYHLDVNTAKRDIKIDKLMQNAKMISHIKAGRIGFYHKMDEMMKMYILHWGNVLIRDELDNNNLPYRSITRKGGDHSAQASVYAMVGMDELINELHQGQVGGQVSSLDSSSTGGVEDMMTGMLSDDQSSTWY